MKNTGIDLVDMSRIRSAVDRLGYRFVSRILTRREMAEVGYPPPADCRAPAPPLTKRIVERIAARFAAKEAVAKSIGCGVSGFSWKDIEILRREGEPPRVELRGKALLAATENGINRVLVSMSHDRSHAVAQAIAQGE